MYKILGKIPPKAQILLSLLLGILVFYGGIKYEEIRLNDIKLQANFDLVEEQQTRGEETGDIKTSPGEQEETREPAQVMVHVVGAVEKPGVYTLEEGERLNDAVEKAGPLAKADLSRINLALPVEDGKQIYVPAQGEEIASEEGAAYGLEVKSDGKININQAGKKELDNLPGIGPALAQRIMDYRQNHGDFQKIEDITKVSGIGPVMLQKLQDKIKV